jgi:hypothetical protein
MRETMHKVESLEIFIIIIFHVPGFCADDIFLAAAAACLPTLRCSSARTLIHNK